MLNDLSDDRDGQHMATMATAPSSEETAPLFEINDEEFDPSILAWEGEGGALREGPHYGCSGIE